MTTTDERPLFVARPVFLRRLARRLAASAVAIATMHLLSAYQRHEPTPSRQASITETPQTVTAQVALALPGQHSRTLEAFNVIDEHRVSAASGPMQQATRRR